MRLVIVMLLLATMPLAFLPAYAQPSSAPPSSLPAISLSPSFDPNGVWVLRSLPAARRAPGKRS